MRLVPLCLAHHSAFLSTCAPDCPSLSLSVVCALFRSHQPFSPLSSSHPPPPTAAQQQPTGDANGSLYLIMGLWIVAAIFLFLMRCGSVSPLLQGTSPPRRSFCLGPSLHSPSLQRSLCGRRFLSLPTLPHVSGRPYCASLYALFFPLQTSVAAARAGKGGGRGCGRLVARLL